MNAEAWTILQRPALARKLELDQTRSPQQMRSHVNRIVHYNMFGFSFVGALGRGRPERERAR